MGEETNKFCVIFAKSSPSVRKGFHTCAGDEPHNTFVRPVSFDNCRFVRNRTRRLAGSLAGRQPHRRATKNERTNAAPPHCTAAAVPFRFPPACLPACLPFSTCGASMYERTDGRTRFSMRLLLNLSFQSTSLTLVFARGGTRTPNDRVRISRRRRRTGGQTHDDALGKRGQLISSIPCVHCVRTIRSTYVFYI